jgi:hypothetical protein
MVVSARRTPRANGNPCVRSGPGALVGLAAHPYSDFLFRSIAAHNALELTVHYRSRLVPSHPWKSRLGEGYCVRYYSAWLGVDWYVVSLALAERRAFFLVAGWDHPTTQLLLTLLRIFRGRYAVWTDTPDRQRGRGRFRSRARSMWLQWIFSGARRVWATGKKG